jgi:ABC-type amino acid transport substrate-binding protein
LRFCFDIALMGEIGQRLGVQIEYRDLACNGLGPALLRGQIDAAIAAISRTPEREVYADLTCTSWAKGRPWRGKLRA